MVLTEKCVFLWPAVCGTVLTLEDVRAFRDECALDLGNAILFIEVPVHVTPFSASVKMHGQS